MPPSATETLRVSCRAASSAFAIVAAPGSLPPCAAAAGGACVTVAAGVVAAPAFFVVAVAPPTLAVNESTATAVACVVASTAIQTAGAEYPQYGLATTLTAPARALSTSWPLLDGIVAESRGAPGLFSGIAGVGAGRSFTLPPTVAVVAACASLGGGANGTSPWVSPALPACATALAAVKTLEVGARAGGGPPSLSVSQNGATHYILIARAGAGFPATLAASLGGVACAVNWMTPDGALASITTPPLGALCTALGAPAGATDCGVAALVLSGGDAGAIVDAAATAGAGAGAAGLTVSYPPALVGADWAGALATAAGDTAYAATGELSAASAFGALATLAGGDAGALITAIAAAPPGIGFRATSSCTDPAFAPPAVCAAAAATSYDAPPGIVCAWGGGDACVPCPQGALCPGGDVLLAAPGYWTPLSAASPPTELSACPPPDAIIKCPGWRNLSTSVAAKAPMGCGAGYRGVVCAACATGFFAEEGGRCVKCVSLGADAALSVALPIVAFAGALAGVGALAAALIRVALGVSLRTAAAASVALVCWLFVAAQSAAATFRVTQSVAPPLLARYYVALTSLQFRGFAVPPACYSSPPYADFWLAGVGALTIAAATLVAALVVARAHVRAAGIAAHVRAEGVFAAGEDDAEGDAEGDVKTPPTHGAPRAESVVAMGGTVLTLIFAPLTGVVTDVLSCSAPSSKPVRLYTGLVHDGAALRAALAEPASAVSRALAVAGAAATAADLERAANDPVFAAAARLGAALDAPISFALVLTDPFAVCYEAAHKPAWSFAVVVGVVIIAGLPAAGCWAATARGCPWRVSKGARNVAPAPTLTGALRTVLGAALRDADVQERAAWFPPFLQALTACLSAAATLAARATAASTFVGLMSFCIIAPLLVAAIALRAAPFAGSASWKGPATAALLALSAVASACSVALFSARAANADATGASFLPLAAALPLAPLIVGAWWRALSADVAAALLTARAAEARANEAAEVVENPIGAARGPWRRVVDADGSVYFVPAEGPSEWALPEGEVEEEAEDGTDDAALATVAADDAGDADSGVHPVAALIAARRRVLEPTAAEVSARRIAHYHRAAHAARS